LVKVLVEGEHLLGARLRRPARGAMGRLMEIGTLEQSIQKDQSKVTEREGRTSRVKTGKIRS
jgi:hypothetical protein